MTDIDKYVENLKSPNKDKRYEASEELRVADFLPDYALLALEQATKDPDPNVAETASRALRMHRPPPSDQDFLERQRLDELVVREPDNAEAWQQLFSVLEDPLEKCDCLKQVVRINPNDELAKRKLKEYEEGSEYREAFLNRSQARKKAEKEKKDAELETQKRISKAKAILGIVISLIFIALQFFCCN